MKESTIYLLIGMAFAAMAVYIAIVNFSSPPSDPGSAFLGATLGVGGLGFAILSLIYDNRGK